MPIFDAIATMIGDGPDRWLTAPPPDLWHVPSDGPLGAGSAWDPDWASACNDVILPTLDLTPVRAVAIGAVGLWAHARLRRPPCDGIRIVCARDDAERCADLLPQRLSRRARHHGWTVGMETAFDTTVVGWVGRRSTAWPLLITSMALPDDAADSIFGYWRWSVAEWVLAVEALAHATSDRHEWLRVAGLSDLHSVLDDIPDVLWTEALRSVPEAAWRAWLSGGADASRIPGLCDLGPDAPVDEAVEP